MSSGCGGNGTTRSLPSAPPAAPLVEASRARVVLQHPEPRALVAPARGQGAQGLVVEAPGDAVAPRARGRRRGRRASRPAAAATPTIRAPRSATTIVLAVGPQALHASARGRRRPGTDSGRAGRCASSAASEAARCTSKTRLGVVGPRRPRATGVGASRARISSAISPAGRSAANGDEARDPPHPLALVGGVAADARGCRPRPPRSRGSVGEVARPWIARAVARDRAGERRATSSSTPRSNIAAVRASIRRSSSSRGTSSPTIDGRVARVLGPEPVLARGERAAELDQLERADDAAPVVRVHAGGRLRVALGEERVCALRRRAARRRLVRRARAAPAAARAAARARRARRGGRGRCRRRRSACARRRGSRRSPRARARWYSATDASCASGQIATSRAGRGDWFVRIGSPR